MPENQPVNIRKMTLPDGFRVGIVNLDKIIGEVADLKLSDANSIKEELLKRTEAQNYVPSSGKNEYATALFREYRHKYEPDKVKEEKIERHQHTRG